MSDAAPAPSAGGDAPISGDQFGDVTQTEDVPPTNTAQNPGNGIFAFGWYPWYMSNRAPSRRRKRRDR